MAGRIPMKVRFPDGVIRYGTYCGTSDIACAGLTDDPGDWRSTNGSYPERNLQDPIFPVELATNYGHGFWWRGKAFTYSLLDDGYRWRCIGGISELVWPRMNDGLPEWWDDDHNHPYYNDE